MHVVTFYSYKGGVGRTMALVNTAVMLAKLNRRVLVVDFDLEAPGLPSYQVFHRAECGRGIVDYVASYRSTGVAPIAAEYITRCEIDGAHVWLMPAGRHTRAGYTEALHSIDWQELYEHQEGYLMFEDLKQQWQQFEGRGFDYVLLDSRTGHTDVGGICTRQLPNAVVILFVPNEQNIDGLAPIVGGIRKEDHNAPIQLHFCPSNVPDLDDEKGILSHLLADASAKLGYDPDEALMLHHYNSLDILAQPAFVISRPNTKLAKEYEALRMAIVAGNLDDEEGAVVALKRMSQDIDRAKRLRKDDAGPKELLTNVINIRSKHVNSGEIAFWAARVFNKIGRQSEELEALTTAIKVRNNVNRALLSRAALYLVLDRRDEAIADLRQVLGSPTATVFELGLSLQRLRTIDARWADAVERALDRPDSEFNTIKGIVSYISSYREALPALAERMDRSVASHELDRVSQRTARNKAVLSHIGAGNFERAMELTSENGKPPGANAPLDDLFNYAIAEWGASGVAPKNLFQFVVDRFAAESGPQDSNLHQCFALAFAVLGLTDQARKELAVASAALSAGSTDFSCWRYLYVTRDEMEADLQAMDARLEAGGSLEPPFFNEVRRAPH